MPIALEYLSMCTHAVNSLNDAMIMMAFSGVGIDFGGTGTESY